MKRLFPIMAVAVAAAFAGTPADSPALAESWENGPPRSNYWSRPSHRFETPTQRRGAISRGERDYQPPAYRDHDLGSPTGLSGPPPALRSERLEAERRELDPVTVFDRDRPMRAPRPIPMLRAPEQDIPVPPSAP